MGARGLRSIMESVLLDAMYDLPSLAPQIKRVVVSSDNINNNKPVTMLDSDAQEQVI